jgi:hypothetical protein
MADTASSIGAMIAATMQPLTDAAKFKPIAVGAYGALADAINRWVTGMVWLAWRLGGASWWTRRAGATCCPWLSLCRRAAQKLRAP